jgi:signal transduction histidine kinase
VIAARLTRLIDHILTLTRAESGQIRLLHVPVNPTHLAATVVEQLEPIASARACSSDSFEPTRPAPPPSKAPASV